MYVDRDVMHFLSNKKIASKTTLKEKTVTPDRSKSFTDIPLTNMRKTIAKRLTLSKVTHNIFAQLLDHVLFVYTL